MVVWMVHVELYDDADDDSDKRNRGGTAWLPTAQTLGFSYKLNKLLFWLNLQPLCVYVFEGVQCGHSDSLCNVELSL